MRESNTVEISTTDPGGFDWVMRKPFVEFEGKLYYPGMRIISKKSREYTILAVGHYYDNLDEPVMVARLCNDSDEKSPMHTFWVRCENVAAITHNPSPPNAADNGAHPEVTRAPYVIHEGRVFHPGMMAAGKSDGEEYLVVAVGMDSHGQPCVVYEDEDFDNCSEIDPVPEE